MCYFIYVDIIEYYAFFLKGFSEKNCPKRHGSEK